MPEENVFGDIVPTRKEKITEAFESAKDKTYSATARAREVASSTREKISDYNAERQAKAEKRDANARKKAENEIDKIHKRVERFKTQNDLLAQQHRNFQLRKNINESRQALFPPQPVQPQPSRKQYTTSRKIFEVGAGGHVNPNIFGPQMRQSRQQVQNAVVVRNITPKVTVRPINVRQNQTSVQTGYKIRGDALGLLGIKTKRRL